MKRGAVTFETVRRAGVSLAGVEEGTAYGMPALKVGKKILAAMPVNKSAEAGSVMVRVSAEQRAELVAMEPAVYYFTEHYADHDAVLVRMEKITVEAMTGLLQMGHRHVTRGGLKAKVSG
jgi:hypothetical protein